MTHAWWLNINALRECNLKNKLRLKNTFYATEKRSGWMIHPWKHGSQEGRVGRSIVWLIAVVLRSFHRLGNEHFLLSVRALGQPGFVDYQHGTVFPKSLTASVSPVLGGHPLSHGSESENADTG